MCSIPLYFFCWKLHCFWYLLIFHFVVKIQLKVYIQLKSWYYMCIRKHSNCWSIILLAELIDCHQKLQKIMANIQLLDNEEDLIQNGTRDITQLCAANVILWTQFLETATLDQGIIFHLAKEHHSSRVCLTFILYCRKHILQSWHTLISAVEVYLNESRL